MEAERRRFGLVRTWELSQRVGQLFARYHIEGFVKIYAKHRSPANGVEPSAALPGVLANGPLVEAVIIVEKRNDVRMTSILWFTEVPPGEVRELRNGVKGGQDAVHEETSDGCGRRLGNGHKQADWAKAGRIVWHFEWLGQPDEL